MISEEIRLLPKVKFGQHYKVPICRGIKKATTRKSDKGLSKGDKFIMEFGIGQHDVLAEVTGIESFKLYDLLEMGDKRVLSEGYLHRDLLIDVITSIYPLLIIIVMCFIRFILNLWM